MPRLIHLNGPSGIGKSTVAKLYAAGHPGVLDLDADHVLGLIGGWQDDFWNALGSARRLAVAMAETHLASGHDVVMPQLATRPAEIERFEAACALVGSEYVEIVLLADRRTASARHGARGGTQDSSGDEHGASVRRNMDEVIRRSGGAALIDTIYDDVLAHVARRPLCTVVRTDGLGAAATLDAVENVLRPTR